MNFIPKISHAQNLIHGDIKIKLLSDDDKNKNYKYIEDFYQNQNHFANQQQTVFSVFKSDNSEIFAGLICAFRRNSRDYFGNSCIVQIKLQNIEENITSVLEIIKKHFYNIFKVGTIFITFQNIDEYETLLQQSDFSKTQRAYLNTDIKFWQCNAVKQKFTVIPFANNIFHITDGTGAFCTLVTGTNSALLVDTLWGVSALPEFILKINELPYVVVNTHCHPDHAFGNVQFKRVLIPQEDEVVYKEITKYNSSREENYFDDEDRILYKDLNFPPIEYIQKDTEFDLGNLTVQVVCLSGHTKGSLGFLVKEEKILIAGDAICNNLWFFMKESLAVNEIIPIYKKAKELDFEKVISSHSKVMWNKNILDTIIANLEQILAGTYFYDSSTNAEIEGYKTTQITYSDQNYDSVILIRIASE